MRKIFWAYLIVMGMVMVWWVPPFQKADEIVHFKNAGVLASGRSGNIQKRLLELSEKLKANKIAFKSDVKFDNRRVWEKENNKGLDSFPYLAVWRNYISYFPVEIGVWIGSLTPYPVLALYLGRMMGLLLFLACVWGALRIIPKKYAGLIIAYSIIPMVIHQATEVSYDVFLLCLAPLILAVFIRTLRHAQGKLWKWGAVLILLLWLFGSVKMGYTAMYLLIPIILWVKYRNEIVNRPWLVPILFAVLVPIVIVGIRRLDGYFGGSFGQVHGIYQYEILKRDPGQFFNIVSDTWVAKRDFYIKGMLGYFGWLDYEMNLYQLLIVMGALVALIGKTIKKIKEPLVDWVGWLGIGGVIIGTYLLIEFGFLAQWTVVGSEVVEGVQGRYLLPLVPLLFLWISQFWVLAGKKNAKRIAFGLVMSVMLLGVVGNINKRYFDYSANFQNIDELKIAIDKAYKEKQEVTFVKSNKIMEKIVHTSDGDVIGGFEMAIKKNDGDVVREPYRYSIKDKDCKRELRWGYLDTGKIINGEIYQQRFDNLKMNYNDICFSIEPIVPYREEKYFDYVLVEGEPMVRLLFISNEVN